MTVVILGSRRAIEVRPIEQADAEELAAAYLRLSPDSKYQRFFALKPRLTGADLRYLTEIDGDDHVALVATPAGEHAPIIAVGRYVRLPDDLQTAEFAITVGDPYQREGIATVLVEQLADIAGAHGIKHATATMLGTNLGAHKLMHRLATRLAKRCPTCGGKAYERHVGSTDEIVVDLAV